MCKNPYHEPTCPNKKAGCQIPDRPSSPRRGSFIFATRMTSNPNNKIVKNLYKEFFPSRKPYALKETYF